MEVVGIFVSPLLKAVINKLLSSDLIDLARQGGVDTSIKKLKKSFEDINDVLADAEDKQISDKAVNKWLKELQHLAYDADDVLDEFGTEVLRKKLIMADTDVGEASTSGKVRRFLLPTCCTGFTPTAISFNFAIRSKIKKINGQLQDVTTRIKELGLVKKAIGGTHKPTNAWPRRETTYLLDDPFVCGRDEDKKRIVELLLRDTPTQNKVDVIPITGMGGIGKTTLAQLIYDDDGVKNHFDLKAWVCVSEEFDVKTITKAILESFTLQSCDLTKLTDLQSKLEVMLAEKKFLLVLDDVWNHRDDEWSSLQSPLRAGAHGSKIIVTTRIAAVAEKVMTIKFHNLPSLSPDVCWLIFSRHAFKNINTSEHPELESIGRQIVAKCGGLPLAARALGGLLQCKQNEHEWKMVLTNNIWDKPYEESGILPALKLSYHHLPSHLKRCFGYCAIIPKDYEFGKDELVLLWMAEGLIEHPEGGEQIEDVGCRYFHELVSRSLFQLSRHNKLLFIMHDLINDLAQAVAGDICFRLENNLEGGKQNKISDKARHSSFVGSEYEGIRKFKAFDDARCLRTFLRFSPRAFNYTTRYLIHDLLPMLKCLRELRLCYSGIEELPDSIGDLKHLRYLDVSLSRIRKLPDSVVTLYNLQVLFLKFCFALEKLPLNMGRLVNLRHFDMTGVHIPSSEEMSLHIGKLTNLQTLSNFMVGKDRGRKIGELKNLSHIQGAIHISRMENVNGVQDAVDANLMSKEELKGLSLDWDDSHSSQNDIFERDVLDVMRPFKFLERLTISGYRSTKFPNWVGDVSFSKMVFMRLKGSKYCTSLPPLGQLPVLKDLYIEGMSIIKRLGCEFYGQQCGAKPFPSLERLSFEFMTEWEDWSAFETEGVQPFSHLSELSIINCPKLVGRLPNDLPCLNSLKIDGCPQLLIDVSSLVQPSLASLSMNNVMLPSLPALLGMKNTIELGSLTMDISHVTVPDSLCDPSTIDEELLATEMSKHLTSITALSISHVEKLAFLPTWFTRDLMGLEKLGISNCEELITLWQNKVRTQVCLPSLCHLQISDCPKLVCLFEEEQEKGGEGSKEQQHEGLPCMTRLEYLTIEECGMLKKLPQDLHTYTSLGVLRICNCASLISFPMKGLPSMLRELGVSGCDALESLPELMTLNNLQELKVSECASLTYLLSRGGLPSTLKQLGIEGCRNLESLFAEEGIKIDCPSLETICIKFCWSLKSLPEANNLRNLSELQINYCYNLEPLSLGGHDENNNNMNQLSSLQKLCLYKCRAGMVSYFVKEGSFPTNITSLEIGNLRVGQLPVPPPSPLEWGLHKLSSLTTLTLDGGGWPWGDTVSFPEEGMFLPTSLIDLTICSFPNLERLSYEEFQNLTSLERFEIWSCPRLASFPKEGLPPSLLHLWILHCPELATFPEQGFPPSLLHLWIVDCNPILKQKCEKGKEYWPIIQYIPRVDFGLCCCGNKLGCIHTCCLSCIARSCASFQGEYGGLSIWNNGFTNHLHFVFPKPLFFRPIRRPYSPSSDTTPELSSETTPKLLFAFFRHDSGAFFGHDFEALLLLMITYYEVFWHNLPSLSADPWFAERAAKFSCFGSRSFNGRTSQLGLNNGELPYRLSPLMASVKLPRVSRSPSIKAAVSPVGAQENTNSTQTQMEMRSSIGSDTKFRKVLESATSDRTEFASTNEGSFVSEKIPNGEAVLKNPISSNSEKRKEAEAEDDPNTKRFKPNEGSGSENDSVKTGDEDEKQTKANQKSPEPPKDYIHVRARRGQATDSHSLGVQREKISERMKLLQDLVNGKALILDEIVNYAQPLQRQVEFLSMKLASVNPRLEFNMDSLLSKDVFQPNGSFPHQTYPLDSSASTFFGQQTQEFSPVYTNLSNGDHTSTTLCQNNGMQLPPVDEFSQEVLANRPDIIREDYMNELCILQDDVPPFPNQVAFNIIEEELGQPLEAVFSKISAETIAAASLGQVYRATLRASGEDVAIKVVISSSDCFYMGYCG
ncbi:unnamed protein product [Camellia sinensis]